MLMLKKVSLWACSFFYRKHLDSAVADSEKEKQHRIQAIKAYESVGNGFDNIVLEYGKFKDELENKQWALAEFDKSESFCLIWFLTSTQQSFSYAGRVFLGWTSTKLG